MKKWKATFCAVLAGAALVVPAAAGEVGYLPPAGAQAYLDLLEEPAGMGICMQSQEVGVSNGYYFGLVAAQLIDMDGDNVPELFYCYREGDGAFEQYLYTWSDGALKKLALPKSPGSGTGNGPGYILYDGSHSSILQVDGDILVPDGQKNTYYTIENGKLTTFSYTTYMDASGSITYRSAGKSVSEAWVNDRVQAYRAGCTTRQGSYVYTSVTSNSLGKETAETLSKLQGVLRPTAQRSAARITLDGKPVQLGAYTIADSNYFKLRDLAALLNGTDAQFSVAWDGEKGRIDLRTGAPYTPVGGELQALPAGSKAAAVTTASVYLDGKPLALTAFRIDGNNYFKLRDLGDALGFGVDWDGGTGTVLLQT